MAPINNTDIKLMLAMIGSAEALKTDNDKLAALLGGAVTANAVRQRVQKIKLQAKAVLNGQEVETKATEASRKTKPAPATKRKSSDKDGDADGASGTPAPRRKKNAKKSAVGAKVEVKKEITDDQAIVEGERSEAPVKEDDNDA